MPTTKLLRTYDKVWYTPLSEAARPRRGGAGDSTSTGPSPHCRSEPVAVGRWRPWSPEMSKLQRRVLGSASSHRHAKLRVSCRRQRTHSTTWRTSTTPGLRESSHDSRLTPGFNLSPCTWPPLRALHGPELGQSRHQWTVTAACGADTRSAPPRHRPESAHASPVGG